MLPSLWIALCAAYATVGRPADAEANIADLAIDWNGVCEMAVASDDDHVIKMTYTCHAEGAHYRSKLHHAAAARLVAVGRS